MKLSNEQREKVAEMLLTSFEYKLLNDLDFDMRPGDQLKLTWDVIIKIGDLDGELEFKLVS